MNSTVLDLSVKNLALAYIFIVLLIAFFHKRGIKREKQLAIACTRMTVQLTCMGYVLMYVFRHAAWYYTVIVIIAMLSIAMYNANKRIKLPTTREFRKILRIAMAIGFLTVASFFILAVLKIQPWFTPQYCIPVSSMIMGNMMTAVALAGNSLTKSMQDKRAEIENSLMLGATLPDACHAVIDDAFDNALLPQMNMMMTMGLVTLPGMMTGQLLSGVFPLTAIKYQMGIVLAMLGCNALSTGLFVLLGYRTFFTEYDSFRIEEK